MSKLKVDLILDHWDDAVHVFMIIIIVFRTLQHVKEENVNGTDIIIFGLIQKIVKDEIQFFKTHIYWYCTHIP